MSGHIITHGHRKLSRKASKKKMCRFKLTNNSKPSNAIEVDFSPSGLKRNSQAKM